MFYQIKAVFQKEWKDMLRDRRTVVAALAYAVFGPIFLGFFINFMASMQDNQDDATLYIAGADHAPALVQFMKNNGLKVQALAYQEGAEHKPEPMIAEMKEKESLLLIITPDYQEKMQSYTGFSFYLYANMGVKENGLASRQISQILRQYETQVIGLRAMGRGIAPSVLQPFKLEVGDLSKSGAQGRMIAELMLLYFILAPFFGSMAVAIDVTAGERERQSLQVLQAQPISAERLLLGKWAVAAGFGMIGTLITVGLGAVILSNSPLGALGIRLDLSVGTIVQVMAAMIPLVVLVAIVQMLIALFAKSFKEAQTYLTMLSFAPALVGMMRSLTGEKAEGWLQTMPVMSDIEVLSGLLQNGDWQLGLWALASLITIALAGGFFVMAARLLDSERILASG